MRNLVLIAEEIVLALAAAVCLGTAFANGAMRFGPHPLLAVQSLAAALPWLGPCLILVWVLEWLMIRVDRLCGRETGRKQVLARRGGLRWFYLGFLAVLQPLFTYFIFGIPLLVLILATILWRWISGLAVTEKYEELTRRLERMLGQAGDLRIGLLLAALFFFFSMLIILGVFGERPQPEGDEPHYLVISYSMLIDGDLELLDEYVEEEAYTKWHDGWIQAHTKYGKRGGDQWFSLHNAGLSAYLVPFLAAGLAFGSKALLLIFVRSGMALLAGLCVAILYCILCRVTGRRTIALGVTVLAGTTVPLLFYSHHIFSETPALLACLLVFNLLWRDAPPGPYGRLLVGAALGSLPWFGVKYLLLAMPFVVLWLFKEREWGWNWRHALYVAIPGALLCAWFFWTTYAMYDTFSPSAYHLGTETSILEKNRMFKALWYSNFSDATIQTFESGLAYTIGQHEGILFYAPWYILGLAGLIGMVIAGGREAKLALWLVILAAPFMLLYFLSGTGGGHSPPGRVMLPVLWFFALPAGWLVRRGLGRGRELAVLLIILSLALSITLIAIPDFLYHDHPVPSSHVLSWLSTPFLDLTKVFPAVDNRHYENPVVAMLWTGVVAAAAIVMAFLGLRRRPTRKPFGTSAAGLAPLGLILLVLLYAVIAKTGPVDPQPFNAPEDATIWFGHGSVFADPNVFWVKTGERAWCYMVTNRQADAVDLQLRSVTPNEIILHSAGSTSKVRMTERRGGQWRQVRLILEGGFSAGARQVVRFGITSLGGNPAGLATESGDRRPLGVAVRPSALDFPH